MKTYRNAVLLLGLLSSHVFGRELHVSISGSDTHRGTKREPLRTIQKAADLAQAGDTITVHAGTYRERVNPPRGGTSDKTRIVYQAARGEKVEIKGSESITNWQSVQEDVWKVALPNGFFGTFNPYSDLIQGDWFDPRGRQHHTGAVYLNGEWLIEAASLNEVLRKDGGPPAGAIRNPGLWFAQVDEKNTTIWAQFSGADPNTNLVEINVRKTVFYPDQPGRNYVTVRGFTMRDAATPWAPPTAEQIGLIGTHWSKGWVIEDNTISHSICSGIALGKHGDEFDNTSANTAEGYVKTIERAHKRGWTRENIGHHVVRHNTISHCEQAGVVGSLGAAFSTVSENTIHDVHVRRLFSGAEMAGIKFHAAIDTVISHNHIYRTCLGLWLDWMAQGTRVSGNLFHDNAGQDLFVEVDHGPFVVDNNLFLSPTSLLDMSEGGAYLHNLFNGRIVSGPEPNRETPFHPAHSTSVAGLRSIKGADDRFYNNIFIGDRKASQPTRNGGWVSGYGLQVYDGREYPLKTGGNVYLNGATPYAEEKCPTVLLQNDPKPNFHQEDDKWIFSLQAAPESGKAQTVLCTTGLLGKALVPDVAYENRDGTPLLIDKDYFGNKRHQSHPFPGPFEKSSSKEILFTVP